MRPGTTSLAAPAVALASALAGYLLFPFVDQAQHALWDHATIASQAAKVLAGGVPHLDFADTYAGAAVYVVALCYRALGERLSSSLLLMAVTAFFVSLSVAALLRPFVGRVQSLPAAFAAGLLVVFCDVPYPSWLALPPGLFAMALLLREGARSLLAAGLLVGLAGAFKQTHGLFHLSCGIAWLLWRSSGAGPPGATEPGDKSVRARLGRAARTLARIFGAHAERSPRLRVVPAAIAIASLAPIAWTFRAFLDLRVFLIFLIWPAILLGLVLYRIVRNGTTPRGIREVLQFVAAAAVIPAVLIAALAAQGALPAFLHDNFERVQVAEMALYAAYPSPTPLAAVGLSAAAAGLGLLAIRPGRGLFSTAAAALLVAFVTGVYLAFSPQKPFMQQVWTAAFYFPPLLLGYLLATAARDQRRLVLFASLLALHLVVYPISKASYLLYPLAPAFAAAALLLWDATAGRKPVLQWVAFLALGGLALAGQFEVKQRIGNARIDVPLTLWERSWVEEPIRRLESERVDGNRVVSLHLFHWLFAFALGGDPTWIDLQVPIYLGRRLGPERRAALRNEIRSRGVQCVLVPNDQREAWESVLSGLFEPAGGTRRFTFFKPR